MTFRNVLTKSLKKCLVILVTFAFCWGSYSAIADSGSHQTIRYTKTRKPPIEFVVDDTWVSGDGYRPVRVRIKPVGRPKFATDRQVTLEVFKRAVQNEFSGDETSMTVDLPEGESHVDVLLLVPQNRVMRYSKLRVWEGRKGTRNVASIRIAQSNSNGYSSEGLPSMLFIDSDVPTLKVRSSGIGRQRGKNEEAIINPISLLKSMPAMLSSVPRTVSGGDEFGASWIDIAENVSEVSFMHHLDLPANWLAYSGVDIIYLSLDDLAKLQQENFAARNAIDQWLRSGGNLWVAGVGEDLSRLQQAEELLGFDSTGETGDDSAIKWTQPGKSTFGDQVSALNSQQNQRWVNGKYVNDDELGDAPKFKNRKAKMLFRDLQLGRVAAFQSTDPLSKSDRWYWNWIWKSLETERWTWAERHGFTPTRYNDGFWQYLIPGVGLAPVNSFRIIITLFALVVGPLNFIFLSRRGRLNWMLFTVPFSALIVTLGLTGYALVTDGVSAKSRIRSVMDLDQSNGHAAIWARQTYYAGVAPSEGLTFGSSAAVYPIDHNGAARTYQGGSSRRLVWTGDDEADKGQHLHSGFLPSRTTSQLLSVQSEDSRLQLKFQRDDAEGIVSAENLLGSRVRLVIVRDTDGQLYSSTGSESGSDMEFVEASNAEAIELIQPFMESGQLTLPEGVDLSLLGRSQNRWRWNYNSNVADPSSETSRLEKVIDEFLYRSQVAPPGTYMAVLDDNVQLQVGLRSRKREHDFHIVRGHFSSQSAPESPEETPGKSPQRNDD